jgi:hypothetical protein
LASSTVFFGLALAWPSIGSSTCKSLIYYL